MLFGAIRLLEYILLIMEQIAWVSRWFVLKKNISSKCFCYGISQSLLICNVCCFVPSAVARQDCMGTTSDLIHVDTIQSMNGIVCWYNLLCFKNNMTKKSNLMILDNSGIDYSRMLLFVLGFLVYWKIEPNSHAFSRTRQHVVYDLISKRSHLNCQKKMWRHRQQFLRFY